MIIFHLNQQHISFLDMEIQLIEIASKTKKKLKKKLKKEKKIPILTGDAFLYKIWNN